VQLIALRVEYFLLLNSLGMISDVGNILPYGTYQKGSMKQQMIFNSTQAYPEVNHVIM
jgi:hypothetical protein